MDTQTLTNSIRELSEKLAIMQPDCCCDGFLINLNKLIATATNLTLSVAIQREQEGSHKKRRLSSTASTSKSSGDVRFLAPKVFTVNLDSDSDSIHSIDNSITYESTTSNDLPTIEAPIRDESSNNAEKTEGVTKSPSPNLKRVTTEPLQGSAICKKRCVVKLRRFDTNSSLSTMIHGLNHNVIQANNGMHSGPALKDQNKQMSSGQVSLNENENITEPNLRPLGGYTYEDYRKRFSDVCSMQ